MHPQEEIDRIKSLLPEATLKMIGDFMKRYDTHLYVVRIWAEQGVLVIRDGLICKSPNPATRKEEIEIAVNAIKRMSVFRVGAIFNFKSGSFSEDWTNKNWILSDVDPVKDIAVLSSTAISSVQEMRMESLYTGWLNGSATIEGYADEDRVGHDP